MKRQENELLPGRESPDYSVFPASLNPDRLIGSENPGYGGGLVLGGIILLIQERRERDVSPSGWSGCVEGFFLCIGS